MVPAAATDRTARRRTIRTAAHLAEIRRQRRDAPLAVRLGVGGGAVVAVETPTTGDAAFRMAELAIDLGPLPSTVAMLGTARTWALYRLPTPAVMRRRYLGDGVTIAGDGQVIPIPTRGVTWALNGAPGQAEVAVIPETWMERLCEPDAGRRRV